MTRVIELRPLPDPLATEAAPRRAVAAREDPTRADAQLRRGPWTPPAAVDAWSAATLPLLEALPFGVVLLQADGGVRHANAAVARLLECEQQRLSRLSAAELTRGMVDEAGTLVGPRHCPLARALRSGQAQPEQLVGLLTATNERRWVRMVIEPCATSGDEPPLLVCSLEDVTETRRLQADLARQAHTDDLTGLANRAGLDAALQRRLDDPDEGAARPVAMLVMDLNGFKHVNDTLGHVAGDALLAAVAQRLQALVRPGEVLARRGGDEFVMLLDGAAGTARDAAERLAAALASPFLLAGQEVFVGASVGAALWPEHARSAQRLFQLADAAMYAAKRRQRGFMLHGEAPAAPGPNRLALEAQLHRALEQGEFRLHYQTRFDAVTGRLAGVEALIRWHHPREGLVLPGRFVPHAEDIGLIGDIGRWALAEACRQAAVWQRADRPPLPVSVNVSARQFTTEFFRDTVPAALAASGLPAPCLELEITETAMMDEACEAALPALSALRAQGLRVLLDDFGTGYSSLAYLHRFPLDGVKIDRSFVERLPGAPEARAIVDAIVGIGKALSLDVIAEGVETPAQRDLLVAAGCQQLQGWLLSRPVPAAVLSVLLSIGQG